MDAETAKEVLRKYDRLVYPKLFGDRAPKAFVLATLIPQSREILENTKDVLERLDEDELTQEDKTVRNQFLESVRPFARAFEKYKRDFERMGFDESFTQKEVERVASEFVAELQKAAKGETHDEGKIENGRDQLKEILKKLKDADDLDELHAAVKKHAKSIRDFQSVAEYFGRAARLPKRGTDVSFLTQIINVTDEFRELLQMIAWVDGVGTFRKHESGLFGKVIGIMKALHAIASIHTPGLKSERVKRLAGALGPFVKSLESMFRELRARSVPTDYERRGINTLEKYRIEVYKQMNNLWGELSAINSEAQNILAELEEHRGRQPPGQP